MSRKLRCLVTTAEGHEFELSRVGKELYLVIGFFASDAGMTRLTQSYAVSYFKGEKEVLGGEDYVVDV